MKKPSINFHAEALAFMKTQNLAPQIFPLPLVQQAIEHGASLVVDLVAEKVNNTRENLKRLQDLG